MSSTLPSNVSDFQSAKPPPKERGPIGAIVVTVILALGLIAIIVFAVTRLSSGALSRPSTSTVPAAQATAAQVQATAAAGAPADATTQQAIQQTIQKVNDAQVQAIETNNPDVMSATATQEFYQEQVSTNQDLVDNGVSDIKLVNIEWGPITVNGNTASATDYETWSTTFQDGTTEQSRDRNVYTLINDNGTWKVQADDHPDQQASSNSNPPPAAP
jgi:hypothetical protein